MRPLVVLVRRTLAPGIILSLSVALLLVALSAVNSLVVSPVHLPDPYRIVEIADIDLESSRRVGVSFLDGRDLSETLRTTEPFVFAGTRRYRVHGAGDPVDVTAATVSVEFFDALGFLPAHGRVFHAADTLETDSVVVLGYSFWTQRLQGREDVVGSQMELDGEPFRIIGVLQREQIPDLRHAIWLPFGHSKEILRERRSIRAYRAFARLRPGTQLAQLEADLERVNVLRGEDSDSHRAVAIQLPLAVSESARRTVWWFALAAAGVFALACLNVTTLSLSIWRARQAELWIRRSVGATRTDQLRLIIGEALASSIWAAAIGLPLGAAGTAVLRRVATDALARAGDLAVTTPSLVLAGIVTVAAGLLIGTLAGMTSQRTLAPSPNVSAARGARPLVAAQLALATIVCAVTVGAAREYSDALSSAVSFDPGEVEVVHLVLSPQDVELDAPAAFHAQLLASLQATPGIAGASLISGLPLVTADVLLPVDILRTETAEDQLDAIVYGVVGAAGSMVGVELVAGVAPGANEAVVNETFAARAFPPGAAIGQRIQLGAWEAPALTISGVARGTSTAATASAQNEVYVPHEQLPIGWTYALLDSRIRNADFRDAARNAIWDILPGQPVEFLGTLPNVYRARASTERFRSQVASSFGLISLILAGVGIYSVTARLVARRRAEAGVRSAIGASPTRLLTWSMRLGMQPALAGCAVGAVSALVARQELLSLGAPVVSIASVALAMLAAGFTAFLAVLVPARRVLLSDPARAIGDRLW